MSENDGSLTAGQRIARLEKNMSEMQKALAALRIDFVRMQTRIAVITSASVLGVSIIAEYIKTHLH